jgi:predicted site-specific integrase-resolvase
MQELAQANKKPVSKRKRKSCSINSLMPNLSLTLPALSTLEMPIKRKNLQAILESAMQGHSLCVVVATKDRLARSGFELIKWLIELSGGQIQTLDSGNASSESFDTAELIGFITSFCNSHYGKRSAKRRSDNRIKKITLLS